jgi:hypothetical protein
LLSSHERSRALEFDQVRTLLDAVPTAVLLAGADGRVLARQLSRRNLVRPSTLMRCRMCSPRRCWPAFGPGARELFATRADGSELPVDVECRP